MRVGVYARTDSGIVRDVLYTLRDGEAVPDEPQHQTHKTLAMFGVRSGKTKLFPKDGEHFMKALLEQFQGSYNWAKREDQE